MVLDLSSLKKKLNLQALGTRFERGLERIREVPPFEQIRKAGDFLLGLPSDKKMNERFQKLKDEGRNDQQALAKLEDEVRNEVADIQTIGANRLSGKEKRVFTRLMTPGFQEPVKLTLKDGKVSDKESPGVIDFLGVVGELQNISRRLSQRVASKIAKSRTMKEIRKILDRDTRGLTNKLKNRLAGRFRDITDTSTIQREFSSRATEEIEQRALREASKRGRAGARKRAERIKRPAVEQPPFKKFKVKTDTGDEYVVEAPSEEEIPPPSGKKWIVEAEEIPPSIAETSSDKKLPAVIRGKDFTLGETKTYQPTKKELKNAQIAERKARQLELKKRKVREETMGRIQRFRGDTDKNIEWLKSRHLSDEDISNIVLEDGTKLVDTAKIKRNPDRTLSTLIRKSELDDIRSTYSGKAPKKKWRKKNILVEGARNVVKLAEGAELRDIYFGRKGLRQLYDPVIDADRAAEALKNSYIKRFKNAGLYKEGGWFTADRFTISKSEAKEVAEYYLGRQGKGKEIPFKSLGKKPKKFIKTFDGIIKETEPRFFDISKKMGKNPSKVQNYAPLMTRKDIEIADRGGAMDWLFRNHPSFFSLKERQKRVPTELYEKDYRRVAQRWMDGVTSFLNLGETTSHLKYLVNSDQFKGIVTEKDHQVISNWLKNITTSQRPTGRGAQALEAGSRFLRKTIAVGTLGLNYASVLKQALTQIPIMIVNKARPKLRSKYAKAFGIDVSEMPSITKRKGNLAISDLQGKLGRIFTGPLTKFDKKNAQAALNGLLDKDYKRFLKEGAEITPEVRKVIEKRAQDSIDMWFGGFFKGQRPEFFKKEVGNFLLMFLYPLTSQLNGFYRHVLTGRGISKVKNSAEVLAAATGIAYMEQVISNLSFEWSDKKGMTKDMVVSLSGNIPFASQLGWALATEQDVQISPVVGNINTIVRNISKGEYGRATWGIAETFGTPKQIRKIKEGLEIMEEGGYTDSNGKMLAPVQDSMELVRTFLRGKYGSVAVQDWVRNVGEKREDRRWFVPQVEFLQNGDYDRKAELYRQFTKSEQEELRGFLSEGQQKRLDNALQERPTKKRNMDEIRGEIFGETGNERRSMNEIRESVW